MPGIISPTTSAPQQSFTAWAKTENRRVSCERTRYPNCLFFARPRFWNGRGSEILKERLYGASRPGGNHGETPKEVLFFHPRQYSDGNSYMKFPLPRYPQEAGVSPYEASVLENRRPRWLAVPEFELLDRSLRRQPLFVRHSSSSSMRRRSPGRHLPPSRRSIEGRDTRFAPILPPLLVPGNTLGLGR